MNTFKIRLLLMYLLLFLIGSRSFAQLFGKYDYVSVALFETNTDLRHFHLSLSLKANNLYVLQVGQVDGNHLMREISVGTFDMYYDTLRLKESNGDYRMEYVFRHDSLIPVHTFSGINGLALIADKNTNSWWEDTWESQVKHIKKPNRFHVVSPFPIKTKGVFGYGDFHQLVLHDDSTYSFSWRGYLISEGTWKRRLNRITLIDACLQAPIRCIIAKHNGVVRLIIPYYEDFVLFEGVDEPAIVTKLKNVSER